MRRPLVPNWEPTFSTKLTTIQQSILVGGGGSNLFTTTNTKLNDLITFASSVSRFTMKKRELSAYAITLGKNGPKLTKNECGGNLPGFGGRGPGAVVIRNSSMEEFAGFLQGRI